MGLRRAGIEVAGRELGGREKEKDLLGEIFGKKKPAAAGGRAGWEGNEGAWERTQAARWRRRK